PPAASRPRRLAFPIGPVHSARGPGPTRRGVDRRDRRARRAQPRTLFGARSADRRVAVSLAAGAQGLPRTGAACLTHPPRADRPLPGRPGKEWTVSYPLDEQFATGERRREGVR